MRRAGNDIQALFGLDLRIGALVELDYGVIKLADNEERGNRYLR
jgi:hypothetical protein